MLEKFIKKDKNEELETILEEKNIEEQAKNLLQGILYKIEVSYNDYKKVKAIEENETQYVEKLLRNIQKKCNQIRIVKLSEKIENIEIQKQLEKDKFCITEDEIISYPIEEKILYAIEKKSNNERIVNSRYEIAVEPLSKLINTGHNLDKIEVLRDFNGWSWTTIKTEIDNITANLIYQMLRILVGSQFLENWCKDADGSVDYVQILEENLNSKYGEDFAIQMKDLIIKIAILNLAENDKEFAKDIKQKLRKIEEEIKGYENTQENIVRLTENKKKISKQIKEIDKVLSQENRLKAEYQKANEGLPVQQKIFSINVFKQQLNTKKQQLINQMEEANYVLNPVNYLEEKTKLIQQSELLEVVKYKEEKKNNLLIEIVKIFLECLKLKIEKVEEVQDIVKMIYQLRYFCVLPFDKEKSIKDIELLEDKLLEVKQKFVKVAVEKKVIANVPFDVMKHVFETRIITLEELYYKITTEYEKNYVQIFDENISEEKFEIKLEEKTKINKKIKIFI